MFKMKNKKAFTIIELIVVMAVIGILVLLAMPKFMGYKEKARVTEIMANSKQLENASERYYIDKQDWPRLNDNAYTAVQVDAFAQQIKDKTGKVVTLDPDGSYYDIDYSKLSQYVEKPKDGIAYILQNPVGEVYYLEGVTIVGGKRLDPNNKPTAVITMTPGTALTTVTNITWGSSTSTDPDGDAIIDTEWQGKQDSYPTAGTYTIQLRVKDEHDIWSDWVSKDITISVNLVQVYTVNTLGAKVLENRQVNIFVSGYYDNQGYGYRFNTYSYTQPEGLFIESISVSDMPNTASLWLNGNSFGNGLKTLQSPSKTISISSGGGMYPSNPYCSIPSMQVIVGDGWKLVNSVYEVKTKAINFGIIPKFIKLTVLENLKTNGKVDYYYSTDGINGPWIAITPNNSTAVTTSNKTIYIRAVGTPNSSNVLPDINTLTVFADNV